MVFRTELHTSPSHFTMDHTSRILTIGSCFANVIGSKLTQNKFNACVNPFGVLFNPHSIFKALQAAAIGKNLFDNSDIQSNSIWYNYDLHSDLSAATQEALQKKYAKRLLQQLKP